MDTKLAPRKRTRSLRWITCVLLLGLVHAANASPNPVLESGLPELRLTELMVSDGTAREMPAAVPLPVAPSEPHLIVYVPATRRAKDCVHKVVKPLKDAGDALTPIRLTTILDVSDLNKVLGWIVRYYYTSDVEGAANQRARFFIDDRGEAKRRWRLAGTTCAYTLHEADHPPLSGYGSPSPSFLATLVARLVNGLAQQ